MIRGRFVSVYIVWMDIRPLVSGPPIFEADTKVIARCAVGVDSFAGWAENCHKLRREVQDLLEFSFDSRVLEVRLSQNLSAVNKCCVQFEQSVEASGIDPERVFLRRGPVMSFGGL